MSLSPAELWTNQFYANMECRNGWRCDTFWNSKEKSSEFICHAESDLQKYVYQLRLKTLPLSSDARVLDIGSGPGFFTLPIAKQVAFVTAVEPARGMREFLLQRCENERISNVSCIAQRWEDVSIEQLDAPYDLVLASFSLGMPDIRTALLKMDSCCSGEVVCFWSSGIGLWESIMSFLYEKLHKKAYVPAPKADLLVQVLENEGISPCFTEHKERYTDAYATFDAVIDAVCSRISIPKDLHDSVVRGEIGEYLQSIVVEKDGIWHLDGINSTGRVSWKSQN
ncbi:MAG: class I SAM-dependent methyltransferase [Methanomicrobiales archaeon]|jgi:ubiquinone/menaquinone biosynthesis C-methylase UbiE|nr:class I SAM-dependent methyltransferase [Methanomicrobiales archaeon]